MTTYRKPKTTFGAKSRTPDKSGMYIDETGTKKFALWPWLIGKYEDIFGKDSGEWSREQENIFLDGEYKLQISASDGGRGRGQTAGDTLCGRAELFSRAETRICSQSSDTNAGRTAERFNKPDWDRNYFWLPLPKRLINGIFMKGAK